MPCRWAPRADDEIRTAVIEELAWAPGTGSGPLDVAQEITVRGSWDAATDTDIARETGLALQRSVDVPDAVRVAVHDRVVTLSGAVAWQYQRQAATHAVRYLPGVASGVDVDVDVEGGVVTLTGTVPTWAERRRVEDACWSAPGVAVVENDLRIGG